MASCAETTSKDSIISEIESLSLSTLLLSEEIAQPPPPPPPLGLEQWQRKTKTSNESTKDAVPINNIQTKQRSIFNRFHLLPSTSSGSLSRKNRYRKESSPESEELCSPSFRSSAEECDDSKGSSGGSSSSEVTVIQKKSEKLLQQKQREQRSKRSPSAGSVNSTGSKTGTLARLRQKTGKSAEDLRKIFPNFYISSWSSSSPSTPNVEASRLSLRRTPSRYKGRSAVTPTATQPPPTTSGIVQDHPDPGFSSRIRQELMLARSNSSDRNRGGDTTGGEESSEDEEHGGGGFRGGKKRKEKIILGNGSDFLLFPD